MYPTNSLLEVGAVVLLEAGCFEESSMTKK